MRRFDRDDRQRGRQHRVAIRLTLPIEPARARHRHDAHVESLRREVLLRLDRELQLGAGREQRRAGVGGLVHDIAATPDQHQIGRMARPIRHALARQQQCRRSGALLDRGLPRAERLEHVGGAPDFQIRNQAQRGRVLDRLVCRAVLAEADRIMREHMNDALLHQRGHAQGIAAVVAEREKRAAVGNEAAMQAHAVHDRGHAELAYAVAKVIARSITARVHAAFEVREVRCREIGGAAEHFRQPRREQIEHELRSLAGRDGAADRREFLRGAQHGVRVVRRQLAAHAALELGREQRESLAIARHALVPFGMHGCAARTRIPRGAHVVRDQEWRMRPVERCAQRGTLRGPER